MQELETESLENIPTEASMASLREKAQELVTVQARIARGEELMKQLREQERRLTFQEIPDMMSELQIDRLGLEMAEVDLVSKPYYKAGIAADWEEQRREEAFRYLEEIDAADLIRVVVTVSFGKDEFEKARELEAIIRQWSNEYEPTLSKSVPWNTLTAFVKEQLGKGAVLDLEKLGATVGRIAQIVKRKK
jgi:uncharacterized protein YbcI